jgi:hypothetical protein
MEKVKSHRAKRHSAFVRLPIQAGIADGAREYFSKGRGKRNLVAYPLTPCLLGLYTHGAVCRFGFRMHQLTYWTGGSRVSTRFL